ncbi:MAG: DNA alkylation repair protein [Ignavibacteria bacterium CG2_30_36_16]|nr:DNA alkylation repair protein [Ignavibacteria bacterium]OIP57703.1 MAG: DNA alkylation repair protein [Ignavibacteria bacterium CG2_30_36_16]PJB01916.1 MAG: DNA alkylation repair protein [Ignavibacteria bacterium CG_4_9_14_3_um_filter_36_18]
MKLSDLKTELRAAAEPSQAMVLQRFFKTGKGDYGEGDVFLGVKIPPIRALVKKYNGLIIDDAVKLLQSKIHEERMTALLLLVQKFKKANEDEKRKIYTLYIANTKKINNWDLVDLSAPNIVGEYLFGKSYDELIARAKSELLWNKRIAVIATFAFIKKGVFEPTFKIAELLINDKHDLIHKAIGWMLREIGKRDIEAEEEFLQIHYKQMPRTMLRYAIEKFPEEKRQNYLKGRI